MGTYRRAGNQAKVMDAANRLLAVNPDSTRSAGVVGLQRARRAEMGGRQATCGTGLAGARENGQARRRFRRSISPNRRPSLGGLLNSVAGFSALQLKDYAGAQKYLRPAVEADPNNVENVYPLALAYLTATPPDDVNGLFFIARAANLVSDPKGKDSIVKFGHSRYNRSITAPSKAGTICWHTADKPHTSPGRIHHRPIRSSNSGPTGRRPGENQEAGRDELC